MSLLPSKSTPAIISHHSPSPKPNQTWRAQALSSPDHPATVTALPARSLYLGLLRAWGAVARFMDDVQLAWWQGRDERALARASRRAAAGRARGLGGRRRRMDEAERGGGDDDSDASSTYYDDIDDSDDWEAPEPPRGAGHSSGDAAQPSAAAAAASPGSQATTPGGRQRQPRAAAAAAVAGGTPGRRAHPSGASHGAAHPHRPHTRRRGFPLAVSGPAGAAAQGLDDEERDDLWGELGDLGLHDVLAAIAAPLTLPLQQRAARSADGGRLAALTDGCVACVVRDVEITNSRHVERGFSRRAARAALAGASPEYGGILRHMELFRGAPSGDGVASQLFCNCVLPADARGRVSPALVARLREPRPPPGGRGPAVPLGVLVEFLTARLLLDHFMAERIETTDIPTVNVHVTHGWRAYWAPSLLRLAAARAPAAGLSWRALAAANDIVADAARRALALMSQTMFSADDNAVEMSGDAVMAALRLALPGGLYDAVAPRARAAVAIFKDLECDDIGSLTWARLGQQTGLTFEVGGRFLGWYVHWCSCPTLLDSSNPI